MKKLNRAALISRAPVYIEEENVIWMVTVYSSLLIKLNLTTNRFEEYYRIPYVDETVEGSVVAMIKYNDELILAPNNTDRIIVFNLKMHQFYDIDMKLSKEEIAEGNIIGQICLMGKYAYLIGFKLYSVFRLDLEDKKCERVYNSEGVGFFSYMNGIIDEGKLYIPMYEENTILIMNLENNQVNKIQVQGGAVSGFSSIAREENGIGLITKEGDYGLLDNNELYIKTEICKENIANMFVDIYNSKWCFESCGTKIWHVNSDGDVEDMQFKYPYAKEFRDKTTAAYDFIVQVKTGLVFQVRADGDIYILDFDKKHINKINIRDMELVVQVNKERMKRKIVNEEISLSLDDFLQVILVEN